MLKKDGSTFISERSTALLRNAEGEPTGFCDLAPKMLPPASVAEEQYSTMRKKKSNDVIITIQDNVSSMSIQDG